jgi:hypothetical protein
MISMISTVGLIYPKGAETLNEGKSRVLARATGVTSASSNDVHPSKCRELNKIHKVDLFKRLKNGNNETVVKLSERFRVSVSTVSKWKREYKGTLA